MTIMPTYNLIHGEFDPGFVDFCLTEEVENWLDENIGHTNYSLSPTAEEFWDGLRATIYFNRKEDAVFFELIWG